MQRVVGEAEEKAFRMKWEEQKEVVVTCISVDMYSIVMCTPGSTVQNTIVDIHTSRYICSVQKATCMMDRLRLNIISTCLGR